MKKVKKFLKISTLIIVGIFALGIIMAACADEDVKEPKPVEKQEEPKIEEPKASVGEANALKRAERYLSISAFSKEGLSKQLKYEKYSTTEIQYAIDNIVVDWNQQAAKKAERYISITSFSKQGLIDQLKHDGFTYDEAVYGVEQNGY